VIVNDKLDLAYSSFMDVIKNVRDISQCCFFTVDYLQHVVIESEEGKAKP